MYTLISKNTNLIRLTVFSILCALFILGCSGSNDSQSPSGIDAVNEGAVSNIENDTEASSPEDPPGDEASIETETDSTTVPLDTETTGSVVPELMTLATRVDFDITVPAFQSNALQVRLQWGDRDISAGFVVDESWAVVVDFPTDTENTLFVLSLIHI